MEGNRILIQVHSLVYFISLISTCILFVIVYKHSDYYGYPKVQIDRTQVYDGVKCPAISTRGSHTPNFQSVNVAENTLYAYSALLEDHSLRILVLKKRNAVIKGLLCAFWYPPDEFSTHWRASTVEASVTDLNEHHDLEYTAAFIMCPLQERLVRSTGAKIEIVHRNLVIPTTVSLATASDDLNHLSLDKKPLTGIPVTFAVCSNRRSTLSENDLKESSVNKPFITGNQDSRTEDVEGEDSRVEFTVCVPVLGQKFANAAQLVEKIEMSRLLGAGRVVFYNHSILSNVDAVLRMYVREWREGRETLEVVVHPWSLPTVFNSNNLHSLGQGVATNDCLYRYKHRSEFMMFTDLGQHIVPRHHQTWHQFVRHIQGTEPDVSGFSFRTVIFRKEWPSPALGLEAARSEILHFTKREDCVSPMSKMIVDPMTVEEMGSESAWGMTGTIYNVLKTEGLVQQYSNASSKDTLKDEDGKTCNTPKQDTYVASKFGRKLAVGLKSAWTKLPEKTDIDKVSGRRDEASSKRINTPTNLLPTNKHGFRHVDGLGTPLFVYSALWRGDNVRLVVIKQQKYPMKDVYCVFIQESTRFVVKATIKDFHQFVAKFTSGSVTCPIGKRTIKNDLPLFVGLVREKDRTSTPKQLFIVEARRDQTTKVAAKSVDTTVCTPAMFNFGNAAQLVEKIEMSRLLGVGRVVFYNHSILSNVDAVLRMYVREWEEGRETLEVVVHPWRLPTVSGKAVDIPYFAQLASIDDCLHRYRWTSRYTEFSDIDEYLVPLKHKNRSQLLAEREKLKPDSAGFLFRCTVFSNDGWQPAKGFDKEAAKYGSAILGFSQRDQLVFKERVRSKLIVKPERVEEMGVHFMWTPAWKTDTIPVNYGLLNHYRKPIKKCMNQTTDARVTDRFGKMLALRLKAAWAKLPGVSLGWKLPRKRDPKTCK
ncbi:UPF0392 protein F13G3.3-like isoform X2 [Elysia marginata]|uniref:UPF0392 protein F13G3.3-like isoform X2 n=1 Tax=Elysia marginata TaxID=1093978 RepID=A0AAV4I5T7_9GAST|nr:UPF0392 protein F13G3.3-like isoform X2 [Elysia marginata]